MLPEAASIEPFALWAFFAWCLPMLPEAPAIGLSEDIGAEAA